MKRCSMLLALLAVFASLGQAAPRVDRQELIRALKSAVDGGEAGEFGARKHGYQDPARRGRGDVAVSIAGDDGVSALSANGRPGPFRILRTSNEVWINVGPPPFTIESADSVGVTAGSTVSGFTISGERLEGATGVEFAPPDGIEVNGFETSAAGVTMNLGVDSDAIVGQRMMSVVSPAGRSNWIPFEVQ